MHIPGLTLSEIFYREAVKPIIERAVPELLFSAGLIGTGSEVLGYDDQRSMDHNWGPRLILFLQTEDMEQYRTTIDETLRNELPLDFYGYPTNFSLPLEDGSQRLKPTRSSPVNHGVEIRTVADFLDERLGITSHEDINAIDWLLFSDQALLEVTAGAIYHDGLGQLEPLRDALRYYPNDIWLYLLATQWKRIAQLEPFVGRASEAGDDFGSKLIAMTLVKDLMRLSFLMERQYAPYSKWFGTAFKRLEAAGELQPIFDQIVNAPSWIQRVRGLNEAYRLLAEAHNALDITDPMPTRVSPFHGRPFLVIHGDRFSDAIHARITDEQVRHLPEGVGGLDQWVDSTDVLSRAKRRSKLRSLYTSSSLIANGDWPD